MKTLSAKYFRHKIEIQKSLQTADGYGGFTTTFECIKQVYAYIFDKTRSVLDSAGQRIVQKNKAVVIRDTEIKNNYRIAICGEVYNIESQETNIKGTQIELTLNHVGFETES